MNRGYIKFWRKAEDSVSWTRGLEHRGMMVTILDRAAWKPRFEWGIEVQPGEFLVKVIAWAETLGMSQTSVRRILKNLVEDGFISVANVANRYTKITVLNWHIYQQEESASRRTDGEQTASPRLTNGEQTASPSYKEEEGKNIRINTGGEGEYARVRVANPVPEDAPDAPPNSVEPAMPENEGCEGPKKTDCPSKGTPEWPAFLSCWQVYPVKQGQEDAWREWMRLKANGTLAQAWEIRDAILRLSAEDSRWLRGKVPKMAKWLNGKGWDDEPYIEPVAATLPAVRDGPPVARTQFQKGRQDMENLARFVLTADKEFEHGEHTAHHGGIGQNGNALPAAVEPGGIAHHGGDLDGVVRQPQR